MSGQAGLTCSAWSCYACTVDQISQFKVLLGQVGRVNFSSVRSGRPLQFSSRSFQALYNKKKYKMHFLRSTVRKLYKITKLIILLQFVKFIFTNSCLCDVRPLLYSKLIIHVILVLTPRFGSCLLSTIIFLLNYM
jgi:hypothetical protein